MKRYSARTLLQWTTEQLWDLLTGSFVLVFDDGELEVDFKSTLYSSYAWDFHRAYPETPMLIKHHVKGVLGNRRLGSDTHLELLGNVMWSVYDHYMHNSHKLMLETTELEFRDRLAEMIYTLTNQMYNDLSYRLEEYVVSLSITDFTEVLNHPVIREINEGLKPTHQSIEYAYNTIRGVLMSESELSQNPLSTALRSKLIKDGQLLQCVSARGFLTDSDSNQFTTPVLRGYAQGLRLFYDSLVESRSAAKSLIFSKTPLQQAEYFSRRLQLMSQIVQHLHHCDCGSTEYTNWTVRGREIDTANNLILYPGDLKQLVGKYYLDESTGKLKAISAGDTHLIGKTIKLRTVIHCAHPDPYGVCSTCFGELSLSVPAETNIGQMACTFLAQQSSQNVLSVKHLDGSAVVEGIILEPDSRQYLKVGADDNSHMLSDQLKAVRDKGTAIKLVIPGEHAVNLTDILEVKDVESLNITRVSELPDIAIRIGTGELAQLIRIEVNQGRRLASMTYSLLKYIRNHWDQLEIDARGNYVVDMKDWDWNKNILTLPLRHFNMSDHSRDIATMLESSVDKLRERDNTTTPDAALVELFDLVNTKLTVNLAVLDLVLYGSMVVSMDDGDYGLPKPWTKCETGVMKLSMMRRSAAAAMAFENHRDFIVSPNSYIETNRTDHPFDGILMPGEVFGRLPIY